MSANTRAWFLGFVVLLILTVTSSRATANLITNGSFEDPVVAVGGFTNFTTGSSFTGPWTVVGATGGQVSIVSGTLSQSCCTFPAQAGAQWLDLTGNGSNSATGVEQVITTVAGTNYNLTLWIGNVIDTTALFGIASSIEVFVNGASLGTDTNNGGSATLTWQQFSHSFTASGASTTIRFINRDPSSDNSNGLDNVVIEAGSGPGPQPVPEPATLLLLGVGLAGLAAARRRNRA